MTRRTIFSLGSLIGAATFAVSLVDSARAQDQPKPEGTPPPSKAQETPDAKPATPADAVQPDMATVDAMVTQACKNVAIRYNLNKEQTAKTEQIMKRDVQRFLKENEEQVWPLIRELLRAQLGRPENLDDARKLGQGVLPLVAKAKDAIYKGNDEWRMYLTPDQRRMHDYDMSEMDKTFQGIEENFRAWAEGRPTQSRSPFPPPPAPELSPPRPKLPAGGLPEPAVENLGDIDPRLLFDSYVEEFIKKYQLDQGQIDTARSILEEYNAKANDFKNANKQELAKVVADLRAAHEAGDRDKLLAAEAKRKALLDPVYKLFGEMNDRLMGLLTTAQIERAKSAPAQAARTPAAKDAKPATKPDKAKGEPSKANEPKTNDKKSAQDKKPAEDKPNSDTKETEKKPAEGGDNSKP